MKKTVLTVLFTMAMSCAVSAANTANITVNGSQIDADAIIVDGRTLVPVRGVFEKLGFAVEWQNETKTANFKGAGYSIDIKSGETGFYCLNTRTGENSLVKPDVPQQIIDGHFYIPLRAVSEAIGADVNWNAETKTAEIVKKQTAISLPQLDRPQKGDTAATLHTNMGDISVRLFPQYAPKAVENFVTHAKNGYYNGVTFHRVINDFMIQGGDPEGTGMGGESIWGSDFENEVTFELRNFRGALCMANAGPDTNGSQFYIVQSKDIGEDAKKGLEMLKGMKDETYYRDEDGNAVTYGDVYPDALINEYENNGGCPYLDMDYTVFGQVYAGMDTVDKIAAVKTDSSDKPIEAVVIKSIDVFEY
ncbi:MAG: peptidylprolyl isomerase [Firmicutes bacterium]|nr:peptidylprolyl isomerase [Bacillota bacterium]